MTRLPSSPVHADQYAARKIFYYKLTIHFLDDTFAESYYFDTQARGKQNNNDTAPGSRENKYQ